MAPPQRKYALISGASSGIGYALAYALAKRGYKVFGCSPANVVHLMDPLKKYGVVPFALDITDVDAIEKAVEFISAETGGRLDILYNNAGIAAGGPMIDLPVKTIDRVFKVNVLGHMYMSKFFAPLVIKAKGTIVFTSSVAARVPLSWVGYYCSTKSAIDSYAKSLRFEMQPFGVKVYSVITGGVDTGIAESVDPEDFDPEASRYNVEGMYESMIATSRMSRDSKFPPDKYAEAVIKDIISKRDKGLNLYHGYQASALHFAGSYLPLNWTAWFIQAFFKQHTVLRNVKGKVAAAEKAAKKTA